MQNSDVNKSCILQIHVYLLLVLTIQRTSTNVVWKLKESHIELGKPLHLECTTSNDNTRNVSRRWTGGLGNRLLCFNGVPTNPRKYKEFMESASKYTLEIKVTTEDDLECPYSCRFGILSDEKILYVTENNFVCTPNKNTTEIKYGLQNENYTLDLEFTKVFPEPMCTIQIKETVIKLSKAKTSKGRIFYHITYHVESMKSLHVCGSDLEITCNIGKIWHNISLSHNLSCTDDKTISALDEKKSSISHTTIALTVLGIGISVVICISAYVIYSKKR